MPIERVVLEIHRSLVHPSHQSTKSVYDLASTRGMTVAMGIPALLYQAVYFPDDSAKEPAPMELTTTLGRLCIPGFGEHDTLCKKYLGSQTMAVQLNPYLAGGYIQVRIKFKTGKTENGYMEFMVSREGYILSVIR